MESGMKYIVATLLLLLCVALAPAHADDKSLNYNLVQLSAQAERDVPNDLGTVTLEVRHQARDARALPAAVNRDMGWALERAKKADGVRVETRQYTTRPQYESGRIVGWIASQELFLESKDFGALGELVTTLQEKLAVTGMQFRPSRDMSRSIEDELTTDALAAFRAKASLVAKALGAEDYEIVSLNVNDRGAPAPRRAYAMMEMAAADAPPVAMEGGSATLTVVVNGQIQLR